MAHAIDRDALHARLVKAVDAWAKGCEATVRPLTARLIERLKNSKATTPISKIVDDEMRKLGIDASLRKSMRELVIEAAAHGYGILPSMIAHPDKVGDKLMTTPWSGDDMTLSERLHQNAAYMRSVVSDAIQTARRQGQTFTQAARVLYDGYNSGLRVIDAAKLPQYMQNVERAARHVLTGGDLRDFQREMRKAQRAVDRLAKGGAPNKALKSAYQQMLNASEVGSQKHLERAIRTAVEERSRYHAERIARMEAARAYFDGFIARNANDDDVIGYKWTIGGRHPKTDICDDHAAADNFHMGAGVYPKDKLPAYPAHPHCLCHLSEVYADEVPGYKKPEKAVGIESRVEAGDIERVDVLSDEELNSMAQRIEELSEAEKIVLLSNLANRNGQPYNAANKNGDDIYYDDEGRPIYPLNDGAKGEPKRITLHPGDTLVDRYGKDNGFFLSPEGTPLEERSLPVSSRRAEYHKYIVSANLSVMMSEIIPWFGQRGGGTQYKTEVPIRELIGTCLDEVSL